MCTVSWLHHPDGYQLFCNRDEKRLREQALPPQVAAASAVRYIAPQDGDFGGTWIASNEFAITLCLLNGNARHSRFQQNRSRGLLLPELISAQSAREVSEKIWSLDLSPYAPFTLAALEPNEPATIIEWDGLEKAILPFGEPLMPLISSSFDPDGVRAHRRQILQQQLQAQGRIDAHLLRSFHSSHGTRPDAYSTCMHRDDAHTVSFSSVHVSPTEIRFAYTAGAPCAVTATNHIQLERRQ